MVTGTPVNPFQPPAPGAEVLHPSSSGAALEKAIAGDYDFEIGDVLNEAWSLTNGFKGTFWGAAIVGYVIMLAVLFAMGVLGSLLGSDASMAVLILINLASLAITAPLLMGLMMLGVRRASNLPVGFNVITECMGKIPVAAGAWLLTTVLTYIGFIFLILPGVYLAVAYGMTMPLIGDRNLPIWQAMETSRKAITHKWLRIFGLYLAVGLLVILSALPLGIGLIWTMPWSMVVLGVLYRRIYGPASAPPA